MGARRQSLLVARRPGLADECRPLSSKKVAHAGLRLVVQLVRQAERLGCSLAEPPGRRWR